MSLITKYRPKTFEGVSGNKDTVSGIKNLIDKEEPKRSFLLSGPKGCGKCVSGETYIHSQNKGITQINNYSSNSEGFTEFEEVILTKDGEKKTSHFYEEIVTNTVSIKNDIGLTLTGTYKHPVYMLDSMATLNYVEMQNITTSDYSCIPIGSNYFPNITPSIDFDQSDFPINVDKIRTPSKLTTDLSILLGYLVANGSNGGEWCVQMSTNNKAIQDDVRRIAESLDSHIGAIDNDKDFVIGAQSFAKFIQYMNGARIETARFKHVPDIIRKSPKEFQVAFLKGLFDCDGWLRKDHLQFEYSTASSELVSEIHLMLLNIGILATKVAKYNEKYDHTYWSLFITGVYLDTLFNEVLFDSKKYVFKVRKRCTKSTLIPNFIKIFKHYYNIIKTDLNIKKSGTYVYQGVYRRNTILRYCSLANEIHPRHLTLILKGLYEAPQIPSVLFLISLCEDILNNNSFIFSKITKVEFNIKKMKVYDFTLPETHNFISNGYISHNTTIGRVIAHYVGCNFDFDYSEVDAAALNGVVPARELRENCKYPSLSQGPRVWLIDECHNMTDKAQEILLKTFEEPPKHAFFILATTEPEKLIDTILDRVAHYKVAPLNEEEFSTFIRKIARREKITIPDDMLLSMYDKSEGRPRTGLNILEKILAAAPERMAELVKGEKLIEAEIIELSRSLIKRESWKAVSKILTGLIGKEDPETIRRQVFGYMNSILLKGDNNEAFEIASNFKDPFYTNGKNDLIFCCYNAVH
jgi:DNA polymerase III delta prime subunit